MSDQYTHGLAADMRQLHAMRTSAKVGSAYSGWRPSEHSLFSGHVRALVWGGLIAGFAILGKAVL